jgi:hypothetical protein
VATSARGAALVDVVAALALVAIVAGIAVPVVGGTLERERTIVGGQYLAGVVRRARMEALKRSVVVAVHVEVVDERAGFRLYADGNGNGVLQRDIDRRVDWPLTPPDWLDHHARGVSFRINQRVPDISGTGWLEPGGDAVHLGRTALLAFSPLGSATSGTIYVAAAGGPQMAVRVTGATGRVRLLIFDAQSRQWAP